MARPINPHKPYPDEFKREAVALLETSGRPLGQIARDLGVSTQALRSWRRAPESESGEREALRTHEREELRRLRDENRVLRQERDLLVKAAAFFAKESETR